MAGPERVATPFRQCSLARAVAYAVPCIPVSSYIREDAEFNDQASMASTASIPAHLRQSNSGSMGSMGSMDSTVRRPPFRSAAPRVPVG